MDSSFQTAQRENCVYSDRVDSHPPHLFCFLFSLNTTRFSRSHRGGKHRSGGQHRSISSPHAELARAAQPARRSGPAPTRGFPAPGVSERTRRPPQGRPGAGDAPRRSRRPPASPPSPVRLRLPRLFGIALQRGRRGAVHTPGVPTAHRLDPPTPRGPQPRRPSRPDARAWR